MSSARVERRTKETNVVVVLDLAGGDYDVATDNRFLSHMMETWSRYAQVGLHVRATGDLDHHLIEDVAIAMGQAFRQAFQNAPCERIAYDLLPMDDALVLCAVDVVDRPYYEGHLPIPIWEHWFRSFAMEARINLHLDHLRGRDTHHVVESAFKAFGRALRRALAPRTAEISTKGVAELSLEGAARHAARQDTRQEPVTGEPEGA
jgi:imidazoleglycerol-phosphate dehydratase